MPKRSKISVRIRAAWIAATAVVVVALINLLGQRSHENSVTVVNSLNFNATELQLLDAKESRDVTVLYRAISKLSVETSIDSFRSLLPNGKWATHPKGKYLEHIFEHERFYVQALTERSGRVVMYSVTTRDKGFNPAFKWNNLDVVLGQTKLGDIADTPQLAKGILTVRMRFYYWEARWLNSPPILQYFLVGINEAGYSNYKTIGGEIFNEGFDWVKGDGSNVLPSEILSFRKHATINVYGVTSPYWHVGQMEDNRIWLGPDFHELFVR